MAMATGTGTGTGTAMAMGRVAVLMAAMTLLSACVAGNSEVGAVRGCPALVAYSDEFQERAAGEIALLSEDSAVVTMLSDYALMRDQTRACRGIRETR